MRWIYILFSNRSVGSAERLTKMEAPCGACGQHIIERQRFAFSGWIVHMECAIENAQAASDTGDDRFGVGIREGNGLPRQRTFRLTEVIPRIQPRFDGATEWCAHRRGQLARYWRSAISEGEKARNHGEKDQQVQGSAGEEAESWCTDCGRALDDSEVGSGDNHMWVPVACARGRFALVCCILKRAEHLT